MLHITDYQRNANKKHQNNNNKKKHKNISCLIKIPIIKKTRDKCWQVCEERELLYTVGENANWFVFVYTYTYICGIYVYFIYINICVCTHM